MTGAFFSSLKRSPRPFDRAPARARVPTDTGLGRGRGEQRLAVDQVARGSRGSSRCAVTHQAGDLDLVHRVDHRRGGAVAAEGGHRCRHLAHRRAGTPELGRHEAPPAGPVLESLESPRTGSARRGRPRPRRGRQPSRRLERHALRWSMSVVMQSRHVTLSVVTDSHDDGCRHARLVGEAERQVPVRPSASANSAAVPDSSSSHHPSGCRRTSMDL